MSDEPDQQRAAVARLTTYCERMIERGNMSALDELNLRAFVNETCAAFDMATVRERDEAYERDLNVIAFEMGKRA